MWSTVTDGRKVGVVPIASSNAEKGAVCGVTVDGYMLLFLCFQMSAHEHNNEQYQPPAYHVLFVFK